MTPPLRWLLLLALCASGNREFAVGQPPQRIEAPHVTITLLSEAVQIPPGVAFTVGLYFELDEHWHVYWRNPGDSGMEPHVTWRLPDGFRITPLRWPAPSRISLQNLMNFGYEDRVVLLAEVIPPHALPMDGEVQLVANLEWLVCKQVCIPGSAQLGLSLPLAARPAVDSKSRMLFDTYRYRLPVPHHQLGWQASARLKGKTLEISMTPLSSQAALPRSVFFFPDQPGVIDNSGQQILNQRGGSLVLSVPMQSENMVLPDRIQGVLVANEDGWLGAGSKPAMRIDTQLTSP